MSEGTSRNFREYWRFDWDALDVMIGGKSSIDLKAMSLRSWDDATNFMLSYGYNLDNPSHARLIHAAIIEAFHFLEKHLMPQEWAQGLCPAPEILAVDDIRDFLLWASEKRTHANRLRRAWSCAILRILHTIAHIESAYHLVDLGHAHDLITAKFSRYITETDGKLCFGHGKKNVALHAVEWKHAKSRESILLKLLHKRANVAETIYDLMGIRIITVDLVDVMLVVQYLRDLYLINFPNCNPSRGRNNLLNLEHFRTQVETLREKLASGKLKAEEFTAALSALLQTRPARAAADKNNPHSSSDYRSIQLTCREMIHVPNPLAQWKTRLRAATAGQSTTNVRGDQISAGLHNLLEIWGGDVPDTASFFPFEVQIVDRQTHERNQAGSAAHDRYKSSQLKAARRRVLQRVLGIYRGLSASTPAIK